MDAEEQVPPTDYSEDGVDLTLIRSMLSMTPAERLAMLEDHLESVHRIQELNAGT